MIGKFEGEYRWLSNFTYVNILFEGNVYPTVEHAYQAAKTLPEVLRAKIRLMPDPCRAKSFGRRVPLRPHWDEMKISVMTGLIRQKFENPKFREKLLATGNEHIVEGNNWGDTYWGQVDGHGQNWLGRIIMKVRRELQALEKEKS